MKLFAVSFLFLLVLANTAVFGQTNKINELFKSRQYFDLRDSLEKIKGDSNDLLFYRGAVANRFNELEKSAKLLQRYIKNADKNSPLLADAYEILADNYTKEFEYGKAADTYKYLIDNFRGKVDEVRLKGFENVYGLWNALRLVPPQTASVKTDSEIQGARDVAKLLNIPVEINSQKMDFIFDTGANISTMSVSTAQKFGLKIIEADVSVGSSTDINVKSKLAVAPEMKIGNAIVRNAVFLVMEDKALSFPQANYQIHAIIGLPVMQSLGRISISKDNKVSIPVKSSKQKVEPNMYFEGLHPIVAGYHQNKRLIFSFDTGAVATSLYLPFFKANEAEITKDTQPQKVKIGGAGGYKEVMSYRVKEVELFIGGKTAKLSNISVLTEQTNDISIFYYGNLGQDLIKQFEKMTLDFRAMQISFE